MLLPFNNQPANNLNALQHAIQHDIEDIADLDEFLEGDAEDCVHAMLGNAGCFY
jgi:hypothetical protein